MCEGVRDPLARRFRRFAEAEARGPSPLYEQLALAIADDEDLLALAANAPAGQPVPNLLFGAVHLLLRTTPSRLARFYPSLTAHPASPADACPAFREFCLSHAGAIREVLAVRRVQTNEVGRCAYLLPAFTVVASLARGRPMALVEIGTSAGLNLLFDRYGYRHGDIRGGLPGSPVQIACALRGDGRPPLARPVPLVVERIGVDLHVVDVGDPDAVRWLEALVWPEQRDRANALRHAIEIARADRPRLVSGDGVELLAGLLRAIPLDIPVCVFHTHTVNQFSPAARDELSARLAEAGRARELYRVSAEWLGTVHPQLELTAWRDGHTAHRVLARCDPHGRWLEWLDDVPPA